MVAKNSAWSGYANGGVVDCQVVPFDVNKLPLVPGATNCTVLAPFPRITLLAVKFAEPVPP
jgi:hypothetical protein